MEFLKIRNSFSYPIDRSHVCLFFRVCLFMFFWYGILNIGSRHWGTTGTSTYFLLKSTNITITKVLVRLLLTLPIVLNTLMHTVLNDSSLTIVND